MALNWIKQENDYSLDSSQVVERAKILDQFEIFVFNTSNGEWAYHCYNKSDFNTNLTYATSEEAKAAIKQKVKEYLLDMLKALE